jgi:hypothetical protein
MGRTCRRCDVWVNGNCKSVSRPSPASPMRRLCFQGINLSPRLLQGPLKHYTHIDRRGAEPIASDRVESAISVRRVNHQRTFLTAALSQ